MPIYPLTAGISQLMLTQAVRQGLDACRERRRTYCRMRCGGSTACATSTTPTKTSIFPIRRRL
ncbi:MAG: hypothetical protein ACLUIX_02990 [Oscillospiraceae bacterium]